MQFFSNLLARTSSDARRHCLPGKYGISHGRIVGKQRHDRCGLFHVIFLYALNGCLVLTDILLYFRNRLYHIRESLKEGRP